MHGVMYFRSFNKFSWIFAAKNSAAEVYPYLFLFTAVMMESDKNDICPSKWPVIINSSLCETELFKLLGEQKLRGKFLFCFSTF